MLQSTSAVWNSQYLKKIFRIPEDQLKILNNIPGWTAQKDNSQNLITVNNKKEHKKISPIVQTTVNTVREKDIIVEKHTAEDTNRSQRFPLRKTSSLDSVGILEKNSHQRIRRSFSSSDITENTIAFRNSTFDKPNFNKINRVALTEKSPLSIIKEVGEMQVDMDRPTFEKSQFSNSGVQCKMSQDQNLELDAFEKIVAPSLPSSNFLIKRKTLKTSNGNEQGIEKLNLSKIENARLGDRIKEILNGKSKIDVMNVDESYISLSVPSAQPIPENKHPENELISVQKESTSTSENTYLNTSKEVQSPMNKTSPHRLGKRKRKSRTEKSKKYRGTSVIPVIEYSSEQIKNMIDLIKVLNMY